jgi:hypothetical protein
LTRASKSLATITGNYESARDAVQHVFAQAIAERAGFRGEGSLSAWVWTKRGLYGEAYSTFTAGLNSMQSAGLGADAAAAMVIAASEQTQAPIRVPVGPTSLKAP